MLNKRLLLVSPLPPPAGGIETWTRLLLENIGDRSDIEVELVNTVLRFRRQSDPRISRRLFFGGFQAVLDVFKVQAAMRRFRPHCVHINSSASLASIKDRLMLKAAKKNGIRAVLHFHNGLVPSLARRGGLHWRLVRSNMRLADVTALLGESMVKEIRRHDHNLVVTNVPNAIDVDARFAAGPLETRNGLYKFAYLGKLNEKKGLLDLIAAGLALKRSDFVLTLIGSIEMEFERQLRRLAGRSGERLFKICGEQSADRAIEMLKECDTLILPSWSEGFPYAILEAMAAAKPVIATEVGAIPEMLGSKMHMPCGLLVPPKSPRALGEAMAYAITNPTLMQAMGTRGLQRVRERYSFPVVYEKLREIWFGDLGNILVEDGKESEEKIGNNIDGVKGGTPAMVKLAGESVSRRLAEPLLESGLG
jgi:glycosyltransferase involved in cell wall biosynthesis